jgi:hypothetical protein
MARKGYISCVFCVLPRLYVIAKRVTHRFSGYLQNENDRPIMQKALTLSFDLIKNILVRTKNPNASAGENLYNSCENSSTGEIVSRAMLMLMAPVLAGKILMNVPPLTKKIYRSDIESVLQIQNLRTRIDSYDKLQMEKEFHLYGRNVIIYEIALNIQLSLTQRRDNL